MLGWLAFLCVFGGLPVLAAVWLVVVVPRAIGANRRVEEQLRVARQEADARRRSRATEDEGDDADARFEYMRQRLPRETRVKETVEQEVDELKRRLVEVVSEHQRQDLESLRASRDRQPSDVPRVPEDLR